MKKMFTMIVVMIMIVSSFVPVFADVIAPSQIISGSSEITQSDFNSRASNSNYMVYQLSGKYYSISKANYNGGSGNITVGDVGSISTSASSSDGKLQVQVTGVTDVGQTESVWNMIFSRYRNVIVGVSGIATITMLGVFVINFMQLGIKASNPNERNRVIVGLIWSGIATTLLASVTIVVGFFWNALKA